MKTISLSLDFNLSPYTGLTRHSWIEAGKYLLCAAFENLKDYSLPIKLTRTEYEVTYPHLGASQAVRKKQEKAENFETLARTFFIAAPLIYDNPDVTVSGKSLLKYYKNMILRLCNPSDSLYVGDYDSLLKEYKNQKEHHIFQQSVESGALSIGLWMTKSVLWDTYSREERDMVADFLKSYAFAGTGPQNWRFFNMLNMAFLYMAGYPADKAVMREHAQAILDLYAGDGWYKDVAYDYYSCWAFNLYAPLWNLWYGYENEPDIAKKFEENSNKLMETYPLLFDKDGHTNMWGRSSIYRNAATSAFVGNFFLKNPSADPGWARRILSGSLLQFLERDDFLSGGIPTLGFYGQFAPCVQSYSCAASPFWMGKPFLALYFPEDHPLWSAKENGGIWNTLKTPSVLETALPGPALCITNHTATGETILRTGKVMRPKEDIRGMQNYSKLNYNTKYPWESTASDSADVESQQYIIKDNTDNLTRGNTTAWSGLFNEVLYRKQMFNFSLDSAGWAQEIFLADFPVERGIIRADKLKLNRWPATVTLASYGFPDNGTEIIYKNNEGAKAIILKGRDRQNNKKQLAMTIFGGFDSIDYVHSHGTNPDSENSIIIYAKLIREKRYGGTAPYILLSQTITKDSLDDFTEEEIFPIQSVDYSDKENLGSYGDIIIKLKNGSSKVINFTKIEGTLMF